MIENDKTPVAYMILRSDGEVHWDEVDCIHRNYGEALEVVETMNEEGDGFTYRVLPLYASQEKEA